MSHLLDAQLRTRAEQVRRQLALNGADEPVEAPVHLELSLQAAFRGAERVRQARERYATPPRVREVVTSQPPRER